MSFTLDFSQIEQSNPFAASTDRFVYEAVNTGPDDPGHQDYVQMWGSDGSVLVDGYFDTPPCPAGGSYGVFVDVAPLAAGYYDISVTLPDGTAAGTTLIVQ
jgi:hypothetical protein